MLRFAYANHLHTEESASGFFMLDLCCFGQYVWKNEKAYDEEAFAWKEGS